MPCGREVGVWLNEHQLAAAECERDDGHRFECHDPVLGLRWTAGDGVDSTGRRYLVPAADVHGADWADARSARHYAASR